MLPRLHCYEKLSKRTRKLYDKFKSLPQYAIQMADALDVLHFWLEPYEDMTFEVDSNYLSLTLQWVVLERAFYKMLKILYKR